MTGRREQAWSIRQTAWNKLLADIKQKIKNKEEAIGRTQLHTILLFSIAGGLAGKESIARYMSNPVLDDIPEKKYHEGMLLFVEIQDDLLRFRRSAEEARAFLAQLFEWVGGEIAKPYHNAYQVQKRDQPELIYGVPDPLTWIEVE